MELVNKLHSHINSNLGSLHYETAGLGNLTIPVGQYKDYTLYFEIEYKDPPIVTVHGGASTAATLVFTVIYITTSYTTVRVYNLGGETTNRNFAIIVLGIV